MTETKESVREFHPSSLGYLQVCPRFTKDDTRDDSYAVRGTKLHKLVETGEEDPTLSEEDREAVKFCRSYLKKLERDVNSDKAIHKEVRLRSKFSDQANLLGTADVVVLEVPKEDYATIIDWKFGFGAIIPAKQNPQTMSYALMMFDKYPLLKQVTTVVVCPLQEDNMVDSHTWDRADLPSIRMVLGDIMKRVLDPKTEPVLNWSVCRYCGGKATCPQMCQVMTRKNDTVTADTVLELLSQKNLAPDVRGKWQQVAEWADDWAKQVRRSNLDAVLCDDQEIEGYGLVRRKGSVKVENAALAIERLVSFGYDRNILMAACSLSLPSLEKGLENVPKEQRGGVEKAEIREKLEALLQGHLREGEPVVFLKRSTKKSKKTKEIE